jgi:transposase
MIGPGTGVRVYLASGVTDMRKGIEGPASRSSTLRRRPAPRSFSADQFRWSHAHFLLWTLF